MCATFQQIVVVRILRGACLIAVLGACAVPSSAIEPSVPPTPTGQTAELPDAPDASLAGESSAAYAQFPKPDYAVVHIVLSASSSVPASESPAPRLTRQELDAACQSGTLRGKPCKVHWLPILWESFEATALQNTGNIALDSDTRIDLTHNPYWATYIKCVHQYRYRQWSDDTPFIVHDIGHPMQGAIVYSIFEQNDPKSRGLLFVDNGNYWRAHLKAMAFVTLYEIQWKIGPISEASIGNSGLNTYFTPSVSGRSTNETGFQDFVITPVYGVGWNIMEDLVDKYVMPHIWKRTHNRLILTAISPMTPCKAAANILRYKPLYYRDFPLTPLR